MAEEQPTEEQPPGVDPGYSAREKLAYTKPGQIKWIDPPKDEEPSGGDS